MRDSVVFYRSFYEAIKELKPGDFKRAAMAIMEYGLNGIEPDTNGVARTVFLLVKPQIDANNKRYENGSKGGRPVTKQKPNNNQNITKSEPKEKVKEKEKVNVKDKDNVSPPTSRGQPAYPYEDIISYLNQKAGTNYRSSAEDTRKHIRARFADGYTLEDFRSVIDKKVAEWKGGEMDKYLRPATLFGSKFESYLNQKNTGKARITGFSNFPQRNYDFDDLERKLLESQN